MCGGPKWKREVVPDHKFDFIDTREFTDNGFMMRLKYLWLYIVVFKSFLVYVSDIFSAITMLTTSNWSNEIFQKCQITNGCVYIPFNTGKWLFVGCIIFSFLLLAYESRKAKIIIASRDISYAFTNVMANNYYSLRSYDHFCFFDHISNSTKTSDDFAFFVFFVFKSWKRRVLADTPRQTINALTLYAVWLIKKGGPGPWYDISKYFKGNSLSTSALTVTTMFTVLVCAGSLLFLLVAAICYVPLLLHIRGNLKEYCCHKVDKRIGDVIKRRQKQRRIDAAKQAQKEAMGDYSHLKNKKGELIAKPLPQPTLPNLSVDDDDSTSMKTSVPAPSVYTQDSYYYKGDNGLPSDYPPMPAYSPYPNHQAPPYAQYNHSSATLSYDSAAYPPPHKYDDDYESTVNLTAAAAPFAQDPIDRHGSPYGPPQVGNYDAHQGRTRSVPPQQHRLSPPSSGMSAASESFDDPYSGYANPLAPVSNQPSRQPSRGRNYDEETGYRRGQGHAL
jgi:hypothetical protein